MEPYWLFWNVPRYLEILFYFGLTIAVAFFLIGIWHRTSLWVAGSDEEEGLPDSRLGMLTFALRKMFSKECLLARRVFARSNTRGFFLLLVTWGYIILMLTLVLAFIDYYFQLFLLRGAFYRYFSFKADVVGFLMLTGLAFAFARRYLVQPAAVVSGRTDRFMLMVFLVTVVSGFLVEGSRLAMTGLISVEAAPFGLIFARAIEFFITGDGLLALHRINWIIHVSGALVLLGSFPYSKLFHIITAPITTALAQQREGRLKRGKY